MNGVWFYENLLFWNHKWNQQQVDLANPWKLIPLKVLRYCTPSIQPSLVATRIVWRCRYVSSLWRYFTLWWKRGLSGCGLLDHFLCEWRLVRHYLEWVWVILGGWGWVGGVWGIILGEWGWVHCLIMPIRNKQQRSCVWCICRKQT